MAVVQHGSIHYSFMVFGKVLQILVVSSNNTERQLLVETFQYGFGDGTTNLWFGSTTKFIYKDETAFIAILHHYLHVGEM